MHLLCRQPRDDTHSFYKARSFRRKSHLVTPIYLQKKSRRKYLFLPFTTLTVSGKTYFRHRHHYRRLRLSSSCLIIPSSHIYIGCTASTHRTHTTSTIKRLYHRETRASRRSGCSFSFMTYDRKPTHEVIMTIHFITRTLFSFPFARPLQCPVPTVGSARYTRSESSPITSSRDLVKSVEGPAS